MFLKSIKAFGRYYRNLSVVNYFFDISFTGNFDCIIALELSDGSVHKFDDYVTFYDFIKVMLRDKVYGVIIKGSNIGLVCYTEMESKLMDIICKTDKDCRSVFLDSYDFMYSVPAALKLGFLKINSSYEFEVLFAKYCAMG